MSINVLDELVEFSNLFGSNKELVIAGGGNTSAKLGNTLYIKASGTSLADIAIDGFVKIDLNRLWANLEKSYPSDDKVREKEVLADLMAARLEGETKRPSVETSLHAIFPQTFVLHLHPALINGLTCSKRGKEAAKDLFADEIIWIDSDKPGQVLAQTSYRLIREYRKKYDKDPQILVLQNHGLFIAADSFVELKSLLNYVIETIEKETEKKPFFGGKREPSSLDQEVIARVQDYFGQEKTLTFCSNELTDLFTGSPEQAQVLMKPFTPDHIVYCGAEPLYLKVIEELDEKFKLFLNKWGTEPKIIMLENQGFIAVGKNENESKVAVDVFLDAMKIAQYSESFGGPLHMDDDLVNFIVNWEVESYRQKQNH